MGDPRGLPNAVGRVDGDAGLCVKGECGQGNSKKCQNRTHKFIPFIFQFTSIAEFEKFEEFPEQILRPCNLLFIFAG
jgi:hypothetical protein